VGAGLSYFSDGSHRRELLVTVLLLKPEGKKRAGKQGSGQLLANTTPYLPIPPNLPHPKATKETDYGLETSFTTAFDTLGLWALLVRVMLCVALQAGPDLRLYRPEWVLFDSKGITCPRSPDRFSVSNYALPTPECGSKHCLGLQHLPKHRDRQVKEQLARCSDWKPLSTSGVRQQQRF